MKSTCLRKLRIGTLIASVVYTLLAVFVHEFVGHTNPPYLIIESNADIESAIQRQDFQSARINLKVALRDLEDLRHSKFEFQVIFLVAIIGIIGFNGWCLYMIDHIQREDLHDDCQIPK